jgi:putative GTP pyrophosphokinase
MLGQGGEHSKRAHRGAVDEAAFEDMEWATLRYSKKAVNRAGVYLAAPGPVEFDIDVFNKMLDVISNWRACHNFPLNTFQSGLRRRARVIDPACLVAQRIKRLSSIA